MYDQRFPFTHCTIHIHLGKNLLNRQMRLTHGLCALPEALCEFETHWEQLRFVMELTLANAIISANYAMFRAAQVDSKLMMAALEPVDPKHHLITLGELRAILIQLGFHVDYQGDRIEVTKK